MRIRKIISLSDLRNINILPRPIVLVPMAADLLHHGHIRILKKSSHLGSVVVGLMTDKSLKKYKGNPFLKFEYRKEILKEINLISYIIPIHKLNYVDISRVIKPDYFVHGTDWRRGVQKNARKEIMSCIKEWQRKVIEFPYSKGISSTKLKKKQ